MNCFLPMKLFFSRYPNEVLSGILDCLEFDDLCSLMFSGTISISSKYGSLRYLALRITRRVPRSAACARNDAHDLLLVLLLHRSIDRTIDFIQTVQLEFECLPVLGPLWVFSGVISAANFTETSVYAMISCHNSECNCGRCRVRSRLERQSRSRSEQNPTILLRLASTRPATYILVSTLTFRATIDFLETREDRDNLIDLKSAMSNPLSHRSHYKNRDAL